MASLQATSYILIFQNISYLYFCASLHGSNGLDKLGALENDVRVV